MVSIALDAIRTIRDLDDIFDFPHSKWLHLRGEAENCFRNRGRTSAECSLCAPSYATAYSLCRGASVGLAF